MMVSLIFIACNSNKNCNNPKGNCLRDIVAEKYAGTDFMIGGTTSSWAFNSVTGNILDNEFCYLTPEND